MKGRKYAETEWEPALWRAGIGEERRGSQDYLSIRRQQDNGSAEFRALQVEGAID